VTKTGLCCALATCAQFFTAPAYSSPADAHDGKSRVLEAGARVMQSNAPTEALDIHLHGAHVAKGDPSHQMEAHHFCHQKNRDFAQCALFDGDGANANLIGIEYIISEKLFDTLPAEEKKYWHPHNYEILSGQLIAPGLPQVAEHVLMKEKINSYGKTWHTWNAAPFGMKGDSMPFGEPVLEWSFNRDGEAKPGLIEGRDKRMKVDTAEKRRRRSDLAPMAKPQSGVDALKGKFSRPTVPLEGVVDRDAVEVK
jgi:hypothetical protein